ncbi:hypothetical protein V1264_006988 [Littorina saxatilis]|uniref:Uncharacterized protein n=1 Tax=Littorina saxatilis TaxID=31220 RepID=A0AAN9AU85_9CAEN
MAENGEHAKVKVTGQGRDMTVQHVPHKADSVWDGLGLRDVTLPPSPVSHTHTTRRREREGFRGVGRGVHDRCCDDTWVDFTADTSLHGLKYIWMRDIFLLRRLLWLTMTLACSAIMMYQIVDRIIYFAAMPVTVDVRVNFNTSLHFPAITICNQNTFRASQAARLGLYELLTDLHDDLDPVNSSELVQYGASNLSMATLYSATKHTLHDLLLRCERRGVQCGADDFELVATDHGMCYTLDTSNFTVNSAGAEDGLSLTLNVEQYEYMPGPHDAAGIKMLLHDSKESPKVHALGQALSAGVHSFLAMKLVSVKNLPSPHGECDSPSLRYYPHYATANCETECRASLLARLCGCRLVYMPGDVPICTLWQYYGCYMPKKSEYSTVITNCKTPTSLRRGTGRLTSC